MYKLSILGSLAFHTKVSFDNILREGITDIAAQDIAYGKELGYTLKLLAIGKNTDKGIEARVHPTFIPNSHPLASVNDAFNAVYLTGDAVDDIMLYGRGTGALPTASAVVSDVIYAATHSEVKYSTFGNKTEAEKGAKFVVDFPSAYYFRLSVNDKIGTLSQLCAIFAKCGVSIVEVLQKARSEEDIRENRVPVVFITHMSNEKAVRKVMEKIGESDCAQVKAVIRVEA